MKLVIQIPCLNEEATLPVTVADLPRTVPGFDTVELLVIDDGSSDRTSEVARQLGAQRVVRFASHRGLARAFAIGLSEALAMGADVVVNTDADNQYRGADVLQLVQPILERRADMVIGARPIEDIPHFSPVKKTLQRLGSAVVRTLSRVDVPDATSGFRAYSRDAVLRLTVITNFTYTLETIIQAGQKSIAVTSVPVHTNGKLRESRLFRGVWSYVGHSLVTILRVWVLYQPLRFFLVLGAPCFAGALVALARYAWLALRTPGPAGHLPTLLVGCALAVIGVLLAAIGVLGDLTAMNRRLMEEVVINTRLQRSDRARTPGARP